LSSNIFIFITYQNASEATAKFIGKLTSKGQSCFTNSVYFNLHSGEDQLKGMLSKQANEAYRPWKNQYAPKNPHSPFGDFPK